MMTKCLPAVILFILLIVCYSFTLDYPFVLDDLPNIVNCRSIRMKELSLAAISKIVKDAVMPTRPLSNISFGLNYLASGYRTKWFRLVNLIIHLCAAIVLYYFVLELLKIPGMYCHEYSREFIALAASALWICHPLNIQGVTYIVQRMTSGATLFYLLSCTVYLKSRRFDRQDSGPWVPGIFLAVLFWLISLGFKEIGIVFPLTLLGFEFFAVEASENVVNGRRRLKKVFFLFVAISVIFSGIAIFSGFDPVKIVEKSYSSRNFIMIERLLTQPRVICHYISLVVFPAPGRLNLEHHFSPSRSFFEPVTTILSLLACIALLLLGYFNLRKLPIITFAIAWFFLHLALESSFLGLEMSFEHRMYLPLAGLSAGVAGCLLLVNSSALMIRRRSVAIMILVVVLAALTVTRNKVWSSRMLLYSDSVVKSPMKARPHIILAMELSRSGRLDDAISHLNKAIEIDSRSFKAWNNLGNVHSKKKQHDDAIMSYRRAYDLARAQQSHVTFDGVTILVNLAKELGITGKKQEASEILDWLSKTDISSDQVLFALGKIAEKSGNSDEAFRLYNEGVGDNPWNSDFLINRGNLYFRQSRFNEAEADFRRAVEIDPRGYEARTNLGICLAKSGKTAEAEKILTIVMKEGVEMPEVLTNLGALMMLKQNFQEAARLFDMVLAKDPTHLEAGLNLTSTYLSLGKLSFAEKVLLRTLDKNPDNPQAEQLMEVLRRKSAEVR